MMRVRQLIDPHTPGQPQPQRGLAGWSVWHPVRGRHHLAGGWASLLPASWGKAGRHRWCPTSRHFPAVDAGLVSAAVCGRWVAARFLTVQAKRRGPEHGATLDRVTIARTLPKHDERSRAHRLRRQAQHEDKNPVWTRIGKAYPHDAGAGLTLILDAIPPDGRVILLERDQPTTSVFSAAQRFPRSARRQNRPRKLPELASLPVALRSRRPIPHLWYVPPVQWHACAGHERAWCTLSGDRLDIGFMPLQPVFHGLSTFFMLRLRCKQNSGTDIVFHGSARQSSFFRAGHGFSRTTPARAGDAGRLCRPDRRLMPRRFRSLTLSAIGDAAQDRRAATDGGS